MAAIVGAIKGGQDHHRRPWDGDVDVDDNDNEETPALPPSSPSSSSAARPPPSEDVSASSRAPKTPTSLDGNAAAPPRSGIASLPSATVESPTAAASSSSPSSATATATAAAAALPLVTRRTSRLARAPSGTTTGKELEPIRTQPTTAASVQSSSPSANASIDPLSQHIFLRTNTDLSKASKLRSQSSRPDNPAADGLLSRIDSSPRHVPVAADVGREKKKGFLGRLSMRASRKKGDANDYASEFGEPRTDGSNAVLFSSFVDAAGFTPHHKAPPRYIRIKSHNKKTKEFDRMFLAQELVGTLPRDTETDSSKTALGSTVSVSGSTNKKKVTTGGAVWATAFSKDGKYLAAGGRDHVVRVWAVISTPEDRRAQEEEEARHGGGGGGGSERLSAPVFLERPVQEFRGHTGEVLDLSWSKNNFLLSTSMDKTVRLWHTSRDECLCTFKHKELVSKVAFHPRDDRFFLAGCLDATLRLWSIPDKNIAFSSPMSDMITAVAFSPDGKTAMAGLLNGFCVVLETDGLKPLTQIHVRSSRGRNAKGSKITGIVTMTPPRGKPTDALVLITSTDARVRIYNLRDKSVEAKFKGHEHASSQLFASFSDDGKYVICGSEDRKAYIWSVGPADPSGKDKYPCEVFDAHSSDLVTTAVFAPTQTRQLLGASGDPIYDLCNPPPVTLMSLEESMALSQSGMSDHTLQHEDGPATAHAPTLHQPLLPPPPPRPRPDVSPAYLARSTHSHGNIIVTSDDTGIIKVFRQDCAAEKRKHESWETGSSFSRKLTGVGSGGGGGGSGGGGGASGMIGRSGSIVTRSSMGDVARSRRGSLSQAFAAVHSPATTAVAGGGGSGSSDRILSWRQGIEGGSGSSRPSSLIGSVVSGSGGGGGGGGNGVLGSGGIGVTPIRTERSISPSKASRTPLSGLASDARKQPYAATTSSPLSPHFAVNQARSSPWNASQNGVRPGEKQTVPAMAPLSSTTTATMTTATTTRSTTTTTTTARPPNGGATPPSNMRTSDVLHATDRQTDVNSGGNDAARTAEPDVDAKRPGPPVPSLTFRPADEDDALRLDPVGASYSFWNLNKWKGIAGLRASLIGGHSGSGSGGGGSSGGADGSGTGGGGGRRGSHNALEDLYGRLTHEHTEQRQAAGDEGDHGTAHAARKSPHQGKGGNARTTSNDKDAAAAAAEQSQLSSRVPSVAEASDGGSSLDPNRLYPRLSHPHGGFARAGSVISQLSSEMTSSEGEGEGDGDAVGHRGGRTAAAAGHSADHSEGGVEMRCTKCGGRDFKARRTGGAGGVQRLHCSRCGKVVEDDGAHTLI